MLQLSGGDGVDYRHLNLEIRKVRLKIHPEVWPDKADDIDITVMYITMGIKALSLSCICKGERE